MNGRWVRETGSAIISALVLLTTLVLTAAADPGLSAEEIERERAALLAIMAQNQAPSSGADGRIAFPDAATIGADAAPVLLIEFGDYQCGFCRRHELNVMPMLARDHVATGRLRYVFMEYPAERNRPISVDAANAALCAHDQGRYSEMRQRLFANPMSLDNAGYRAHAEAIGLDLSTFTECLERKPHLDTIQDHVALGQQLGVRGTPTFFLAMPFGDEGGLQLVRRITGAQPIDLFERELESLYP